MGYTRVTSCILRNNCHLGGCTFVVYFILSKQIFCSPKSTKTVDVHLLCWNVWLYRKHFCQTIHENVGTFNTILKLNFPGDGGTWKGRTPGTSTQSKIPSNEMELLWEIFSLSETSILLHIPDLCDSLYILTNVYHKTCFIIDEETNGEMSFYKPVNQRHFGKNREQYARQNYSYKL